MKRKSMRILITILGGWFGLHRYLNHQIGLGVLYTLTFGLFGIGWFIDIYRACASLYDFKPPVQPVPTVEEILTIDSRVYKLSYSYNRVELYTMHSFNFTVPFGAQLGFRTEPSNTYDSRAIYFLWNNTNIGYIHIGRLQDMIHDYMRPGRYILAKYEGLTEDGNVLITLSFYKESL
ncbi:TM2 domain-containing protein [Dorea formicigenerans]|uniref:TM2 domain-containing protein n=1 Tax=Dorea formicigenerans TaxID=39486 RepID=UPI0022E1B8B4|nr:NINE protein [Dorea formicigenerans]